MNHFVVYMKLTQYCHSTMKVKVAQLCLTLCNPTDCSPPGCSVHGISQARILERVAISSSRGSSRPRDQTPNFYVSCIGRWVLYHQCHLRLPWWFTPKSLCCTPWKKRAPSLPQPIHTVWYGLDACVPCHPHLKFICWCPNSQCDGIWRQGLWE